MADAGAVDRALRFTWAGGDAAAGEVVPVGCGTVLRTPELPGAWSVNCLRVEGPQPELTLAGAEALCADHLGHVGFRHVLVQEERTAERLAADARAAGWEVDVEVLMLLDPAAAPPAASTPEQPAASVREGSLDEVLALMEVWFTEEDLPDGEEALAQLREMSRREHTAVAERRLLVDDPPGRPAAMTSVREAGGVCQVEDVFALADVRGRGHGRALVTHAAALARQGGHDLAFIVADDQGWPKHLYASVGFVPAARRAILHRDG